MTTEEKIQVQGIGLGWIVVKNLDEAIAFYTDVVGLEMFQHTPEFGWAELKGEDGARLGLAQENDEEIIKAGSNAVLCMNVKDIEASIAIYKEKGGEVIGEVITIPGHVKMQFAKDSSGNVFQLVQHLDEVNC